MEEKNKEKKEESNKLDEMVKHMKKESEDNVITIHIEKRKVNLSRQKINSAVDWLRIFIKLKLIHKLRENPTQGNLKPNPQLRGKKSQLNHVRSSSNFRDIFQIIYCYVSSQEPSMSSKCQKYYFKFSCYHYTLPNKLRYL